MTAGRTSGSSKSRRGAKSSGSRSRAPRSGAKRTRSEQKEQTRRALLDAVLVRMEGDQAFTDVSIREITGDAGVVPATFYRHFADMGELGMVLVDESFSELRNLMRDIRDQPVPTAQVVENSVRTFLGYAHDHPLHFRFIAKERYGGSSALRLAIGREIQLWTSELATDFARFDQARALDASELMAVSSLVIGAVTVGTERVLDLPDDTTGDRRFEEVCTETQLQVSVVVSGAIFYPAYRDASLRVRIPELVEAFHTRVTKMLPAD